MSDSQPNSNVRTSVFSLIGLAILLAGAYFLGVNRSSRDLISTLKERDAKGQLVDDMLANLRASSEAEKRAVMTESDEDSKAFADESEQKSAAVQQSRGELEALIKRGHQTEQLKLIEEFDASFAKYQTLNREILDLDAESTNLKAQRLSFGPATEALKRFETALNQVAADQNDDADGRNASATSWQAVAAAYKLLALQSRHIVEPNDKQMTLLETEMGALDKQIGGNLETLSQSAGQPAQAAVEQAQAAYKDFQAVQSQIIELSRQNSNIRSLALSLGEKRMATARCIETLTALRKAIRGEEYPATRW